LGHFRPASTVVAVAPAGGWDVVHPHPDGHGDLLSWGRPLAVMAPTPGALVLGDQNLPVDVGAVRGAR
jgi:hypothetical protein